MFQFSSLRIVCIDNKGYIIMQNTIGGGVKSEGWGKKITREQEKGENCIINGANHGTYWVNRKKA